MNTVRTIHLVVATLSVTGFIFRGFLHLNGSALLKHRFVRIAPHINDMVLLGTGVAMVTWTQPLPALQGWLIIKLLMVLLYILLGIAAFRFARTRPAKLVAFVLALGCFSLVVVIALNRGLPQIGVGSL